MKRIILLVSLFALTAAVLSAQPKLEIENGNEYNWGKVKPDNSPLKAKVKIYNNGNAELVITNVRPGCGCTTAPLDKYKIPPGDFANLDITLNVSSNTGSVIKSILIESNDSERKSFHYYLKAIIDRAIEVNPQFLAYNELYSGKEASAKTILKNTTANNIIITGIEVQPATLKTNLKVNDIIPSNGELALEAILTPTSTGMNNIKVTLKTNCPDAPTIEISGWGKAIESPVSVNSKK